MLPELATKFFSELVKERTTEQGEIVEPSSETVNFYIQTVKAFFNLEMQKRHIKGNPFDGVNYLRVERQIRDYYTETELKSFFAQEMDPQMRGIFTVFLHAGLRYGELANLKVSNIDLKNNIMSIRSSGDFQTKTFKSQRDIPLNETLIKLFTETLKNRNPEEYIFTTKHNNRVSQKELLRYCKLIGEKAGITSRTYLHKFRHTFATQLSLKGCRVEAINKLLGHANIQDTMIYTHLESGKLHKEIRILDGIASDKTKGN
jgi:site-specific recombinase XerD